MAPGLDRCDLLSEVVLYLVRVKVWRNSENVSHVFFCLTQIYKNKVFERYHDKTFYAICEQQRRRSACADVQSDQSIIVVHCLDSIP